MKRILPLLLLLVVSCGGAFAQGQITRPGKQTTAPAKPAKTKPQPKPSKAKPQSQPKREVPIIEPQEKAQRTEPEATPQVEAPVPPNPIDGEMLIGGINYRLDSSSMACEVIRGEYSGDVVIPSKVDYNGFEYRVTKIAAEAFKDCKDLSSVSIPNSILEIGKDAFRNCWGLKKAEFAGVESMCKLRYDNFASNPISIAHCFYINGKEVQQLVIPYGVTTICAWAFFNCQGLTSVNIPSSVTSIEKKSFLGCSGLTSVDIPNSVTSIGKDAFYGCFNLSELRFEAGSSEISIDDSFFNTPVEKKIKGLLKGKRKMKK